MKSSFEEKLAHVALIGFACIAAFAGFGMARQVSKKSLAIMNDASAPRVEASSPELIAKGKEIYASFCLACHGPEDVGIDSPSNLFDQKWYHSPDAKGMGKAIREGIIEKGMPGWGQMIPDEDIQSVIAYLLSFQTSKPQTHE